MARKRPHLVRPLTQAICGLTFLLLLVAGVGGCNSDTPTPLGANLHETVIDTSLATLAIDQVVQFGALDVSNPSVPADRFEVLYIGGNGADASSILANYDFSVFDHPDSAYLLPFLTPENIRSVDIRLTMLRWYYPAYDDTNYTQGKPWPGAAKYYDIHQLSAPFDSLTFPAGEPDYDPSRLDVPRTEPLPRDGAISIDIYEEPVLEWLAARAEVGVIIREGAGSDPGLLGFASKEMAHGASTLEDAYNAQISLGPALRIDLELTPEEWGNDRTVLIIRPRADVSTWHQLQSPSTDVTQSLMLRSHLRAMPVIRFDLSSLPAAIRINKAELVVCNDTTRSVGHWNALTVSEIAPGFAPDATITSVKLDDIEPEIYFLDGLSADPIHLENHTLRFDVSASIQRYVNGAYEGERAFLLANGEYFFPGWNSNPDPDFWFTKWVFFGTDAADPAQRPRLEITYTRVNELAAGEVQ